jgi:hypothetical protein
VVAALRSPSVRNGAKCPLPGAPTKRTSPPERFAAGRPAHARVGRLRRGPIAPESPVACVRPSTTSSDRAHRLLPGLGDRAIGLRWAKSEQPLSRLGLSANGPRDRIRRSPACRARRGTVLLGSGMALKATMKPSTILDSCSSAPFAVATWRWCMTSGVCSVRADIHST